MGDKGGALVMSVMSNNVTERGIRVEYEARVLTLIIDDEGAVQGLVVRINQQELNVRARKGVILCAGGFVMNDAMLKQYAPDLLRCNYQTGNPGDMGTGILMGMGVGGAAINMHEGFVSIAYYQPASLTNGIFINQMGQRFINEDCYHGRVGSFALKQPGDRIFLVFNVEDYGNYEQINYIFAPVAGTGDSVEELEQELELTAGSLAGTLAMYNQHAAKGEDPLFHKSAEWLKPIEPPLVALDCTPGRGAFYSFFTLGGLDTQPSGEVLSAEGQVIKGLYAAGRTACGIVRRGDGYSSGMSVGDATFSGRLAGKAAASR
ncbi:FAD-binding protein [Oceanicoccus sp. KOV_DT_Chl]|uniref:FAD-binding protein n=1 Tax=Oceanicoccus sp. KOV_DT_Chl TaxID=1904639 RepID=UPI0021018079|nr:FAD-binding protein [Oceanicoccus sp. KOV_DT_Chl]